MNEETLKKILLTTGYTQQIDKHAIFDYVKQLQQENKQLKHIIDELKKWLEERIDMCFTTIPDYEIYITRQEEKHILQEVLNKLQELKGSDK